MLYTGKNSHNTENITNLCRCPDNTITRNILYTTLYQEIIQLIAN